MDKRTDVIFWSTGDEICNVMTMQSKVDDAYEEISYKIEMTIKNRQSYAENDSDNMEIFKRIDRLRRMVRTLRSSAFCEIMSGCAKVHSPIQRTNLMMKDPSYRTCYKLWRSWRATMTSAIRSRSGTRRWNLMKSTCCRCTRT